MLVSIGLFHCALFRATAQQPPAAPIPESDVTVVTSDGKAHISRVVPTPRTVSPEAQHMLARPVPDVIARKTLQQRRTETDAWQNRTGDAFRAIYPVTIQQSTIAGVPVRVITPPAIPEAKKNRVLINLHGGGFNSDSGSYTESVPVAALSDTVVVAVLYRLAPEHKFPAAVDDVVAVYREMLKTHRPQDIGIFGTSAGAVLTGQVAVALRHLNLPVPAALGIFSGHGDFSRNGDSESLYSLGGLSGHHDPPKDPEEGKGEYAASTKLTDPLLSPLFADLKGMPPTLFITSGRDILLSGTSILHRAFLRAGADARLVVFEGLPHAFWNDPALPETKEADQIMANFFADQLGK